MSGVPEKPDRDRALDFQGFLNNLRDWDISTADRKLKSQGDGRGKNVGKVGVTKPYREVPLGQQRKTEGSGIPPRMGLYDFPGSIIHEDTGPDAASEKELGNEYFKKRDFQKAIECYSRSIALSPTAVAFANRAMAYLKIKRYEDAENDCTEALNFDDRYVKAYSRRATARKELGKFKESIEDSEFASRLEPNNQELQKLYTETKVLLEKVPRVSRNSLQGIKVLGGPKGDREEILTPEFMPKATSHSFNERSVGAGGKHLLETSMQEVAARASSLVMASSAKNIRTPRSAYEFEVTWRALSNDSTLKATLLKGILPANLPNLFQNALSAPLLVDIIKSITTFFKEETELAVSYLVNLTKVPRFDMIVMCLSASDQAELARVWNDVFCSCDVPEVHLEALTRLRSKFCPRC